MSTIGIIGAGVSSLHLGLRLRDLGVAATLYAPQHPHAYADLPLQNTVSHQFDTVERERAMGIEFWNESNCRVTRGHNHWLRADGMSPLEFWGDFVGYGKCVDYRLYLPRLIEEFVRRGGQVVYGDVSPANLDELTERHALLAIGTGKSKGGFADLFPRDAALSRHEKPARLLCCGLFQGVADSEPCGVTVSISVGHGELIVLPMQSAAGAVTALLFENRADGDMAGLMSLAHDADPAAFHQTLLDKLALHHHSTYRRIDRERFQLTRRQDLLQGCFTPIVRTSHAALGHGRQAIAIGDLRCTLDPVTGQGANLGSYGAWVLADHIAAADGCFDEAFCRAYEQAIAHRTVGTVQFTNSILDPAPHVIGILMQMARNRAMCDDFTARFSRPETIWWEIFKDAETAQRYLARFESEMVH